MNQKPEIAIIEPNTLTALGLKSILEKIIPMAVIRTFHNFGELVDDTPDMYAHYFIAAQIYVEHNTFFLPRKKKTIVLAGESQPFQLSAVRTLNIYGGPFGTQLMRTAATTSRPLSRVYSQVDRHSNLSPYLGVTPVS